jgi:predicted MFS family arabinose efflux permease
MTEAAIRARAAQPGTRAWFVLAILCFVYVLNFIDRQLVSILAKPIQDALGVTDTQIGLITGLYFGLFYCLIAIPVGWLADKTNRVRVLSLACALWSAATIGCGVSTNYAQLFTARMAVGVGEAGGVPPSYAIISDYFPKQRRGAALSLFNLGPPIGQSVGVAVGAAIAAAYSWRHAFVVVGAIGVATAVAVWALVREPARGGLDETPTVSQAPGSGFLATAKAFFSNPALTLMAIGGGITQIITYGAGNFATLYLMRERAMTLQEVSLWYALMVGVCMSGGIFASGLVIDRFTPRSKAAFGLIPALSLTAAAPLFLGFVASPTWQQAMLFLAGPTALNYFYLSSSVTLVQQDVRPDRRVLSGALLLLVMNLTGMGVGPTLVGAISDHLLATHPDNRLQLALLCLTPFYVLAIVIFLIAARVLKRQAAAASGANP